MGEGGVSLHGAEGFEELKAVDVHFPDSEMSARGGIPSEYAITYDLFLNVDGVVWNRLPSRAG